MKDAVIDKAQSKVTHALRRKMTAIERNLASENALHPHTDTKPVGALKLGKDDRLAKFNIGIQQKLYL